MDGYNRMLKYNDLWTTNSHKPFTGSSVDCFLSTFSCIGLLEILLWLMFLWWRYFVRLWSYEDGTRQQTKQEKSTAMKAKKLVSQEIHVKHCTLRSVMGKTDTKGGLKCYKMQPDKEERHWPSFPAIFTGYSFILQLEHTVSDKKRPITVILTLSYYSQTTFFLQVY